MPTEQLALVGELVPTFADKGCHVVSMMDSYGCILGFLDRFICIYIYLYMASRGSCILFIWARGHVSLHVMNVTWTDLDSLAFF
jgi:hypothetical protein